MTFRGIDAALIRHRPHTATRSREVRDGVDLADPAWMRLGARLAAPFVCLAVTACVADSKDPPFAADAAPVEPMMDLSEAYRAVERLTELERALGALVVDGRFPRFASPGLTPSAACCSNVGQLCPSTPALWGAPAWEQLGFAIDVPQAYQYSVQGTETNVTFLASGDLDCDGIPGTLVVSCSLPGGVLNCTLTLPAMIE